jgi:hypothetical protein
LTRTRLEDVNVYGHPSHGFVLSGYGYHSVYQRLLAESCKGHGYIVDGGETTGKVNVSSPGIATLQHCWAVLNGGHGLMIGNPVAKCVPFRILVDNFESGDNGQNPAMKVTPDDVWLFGENCEVRRSAFGGIAPGIGFYGMRISGRGWIIHNTRFIYCERSVTISGETLAGTSPAASTVENARAVGTTQPVGVMIEAGAVNNRIILPLTSNMTVAVQDNAAVSAGNVVVTLPPHASLTLAATQNDYQWPLGRATLRLTGASGGSTITGLAWPSSCRQIRLVNVSVANITLAHQNTGSVAANRILSSTGADVVLQTNGFALLEYDPGTSRWRVMGSQLGATVAVTKDEVPVEDVVIDGGEAHEYEFLEHLIDEIENPDATDAAAPTAKKTK